MENQNPNTNAQGWILKYGLHKPYSYIKKSLIIAGYATALYWGYAAFDDIIGKFSGNDKAQDIANIKLSEEDKAWYKIKDPEMNEHEMKEMEFKRYTQKQKLAVLKVREQFFDDNKDV